MNNNNNVNVPGSASYPGLAELGANWAELPIMERVKRLSLYIDKGYSRRELAHALGCSEALVRQLLRMEDLNEEEKQAFQTGTLSVRTALQRIKERENIEGQQQLEKAEQKTAQQAETIANAFKI